MKVELLGLYFNEMSIESDKEPYQELTIEKDTLDRSSQEIMGRFTYEIDSRSKLVWSVTFDGKSLPNMGSNIPLEPNSGNFDTVLFRYPNSAKAGKAGAHKIHIKCGIIPNIVQSQAGLVEWKQAQAISEVDFVINLLPNKMPRD